MSTHRLIVFTEPKSGQEAEYNTWYNEVHLKEVLEIEGFVAAQRFEIAPTQIGGGTEPTGGRYLAIYEIEAESMEQAMANLGAAAGTMNMSDALDLSGAKTFGYTAIGDKQHAR